MKVFGFVLAVVLASPLLAQDQPIRATLSSISIQQCIRAPNAYELNIKGVFEVENRFSKTLLIAKQIDVVSAIMASSSREELLQERYSFVMNQQFGGSDTSSRYQLENFIALKPGGKGLVQISVVVPVRTAANDSGADRLRPGKHWVEFEFSTLPYPFPREKEYKALEKKWKATGEFLKRYVLTEPFLLEVVPDTNSPKCDFSAAKAAPLGMTPSKAVENTACEVDDNRTARSKGGR